MRLQEFGGCAVAGDKYLGCSKLKNYIMNGLFLIYLLKIKIMLLALPGWVGTLAIIFYAVILLISIVLILKKEKPGIIRLAFILLAIFVPLFSFGYIIFAAVSDKKIVNIQD